MLTIFKQFDIINSDMFFSISLIKIKLFYTFYRQRSSRTMSNTRVHRVCLKSTPATEESVNSENVSNYQELNFALQENPYQSMSR